MTASSESGAIKKEIEREREREREREKEREREGIRMLRGGNEARHVFGHSA